MQNSIWYINQIISLLCLQILGSENISPIERELTKTIEGPINDNDTKGDFQLGGNSSQENENKVFSSENAIPSHDRLLESMEKFSNELNLMLPQEMGSLLRMMHSQINRDNSAVISERIFPELQNILCSKSSRQRDTESGASSKNQELNANTDRLNTKLPRKNTRSAFDLRNTENCSPRMMTVATDT